MNATSSISRTLGMVVLALAVATAACTSATAPADGTAAAAEVTALWSKAFDAGDPSALAALYADDARTLPPGGPAVAGRSEIESYWRSDIGEGGATTTLTPADAIVQGDGLHVEGTYRVTNDQAAELAGGQYQQLWMRQGGDWQLLREMWRMDPAPQQGSDLAEHLTSSWTSAYNKADAAALVALYSDDGVVSTVQEGSFAGKPAIESFWKADFGGGTPSSTLTLTDVYVSASIAHLEGDYKVGDSGSVTEGRYMQLWMREGNDWRIHREMWWR
jgi:ketosteroid isomerase-like protein